MKRRLTGITKITPEIHYCDKGYTKIVAIPNSFRKKEGLFPKFTNIELMSESSF